jgi:hypothetical protein
MVFGPLQAPNQPLSPVGTAKTIVLIHNIDFTLLTAVHSEAPLEALSLGIITRSLSRSATLSVCSIMSSALILLIVVHSDNIISTLILG